MNILIDADGCPVVDLTLQIAKQVGIPVIILCDTSHQIECEGAQTLVFDKGADSVDFALVNRVKPGDIVVTQDYGLASMCLARCARVLNQNGLEYTADNMDALMLRRYGVLAPLIARPRPDGDGYEIISGHRRQYAAKLAGLDTLPVIVRNMDDNAAVLLMVDSNLQREHILPSERAFAYKMKLEALKNQGARSDLTSCQVGTKFRADESLAEDSGESARNVQRFIRLTNLIPELLDMVDEKKISFNPAVELSYLDESQQRDFLEAMQDTQNAPSLSQAQQLKKMAQQGEFSYEKAFDVMGQEKKSEKDTVTIKNETLRKYFPRSYTPKQMEEKIIQLLDAWQKKQQRRNER